MKINFGCGKRVWAGFYNIDAIHNPGAERAPELLHAIRFTPDGQVENPIPLADGCADELYAMHVIEHVYRWEANALVLEWARLLKSGGRLILELPNIEAAAKNLLAGQPDQMGMWPLYGDWEHRDPYMMHRHGYTPKTIAALAKECGLVNITMLPPKTHGARANRDMRLEAIKA